MAYLSKKKSGLPWTKKTPSEWRLDKLRLIYAQIKNENDSNKQTQTQKIWASIHAIPKRTISKASTRSSTTTLKANSSRMVLARAIGNEYSRQNFIPRSDSSSMSIRSTSGKNSPSEMLIGRGRQYGNEQSQRNVRQYMELQKRNADHKENMDTWLCQWSNKNISHEYGNYYNLKNRLVLLEERQVDMIKIYGQDRFLDEYTEILEECWKFERGHKNVAQFATSKIERVLIALENMEWNKLANTNRVAAIMNRVTNVKKPAVTPVPPPTSAQKGHIKSDKTKHTVVQSEKNLLLVEPKNKTVTNNVSNKSQNLDIVQKTPSINKLVATVKNKSVIKNLPEKIDGNENEKQKLLREMKINAETIISNCLLNIATEKEQQRSAWKLVAEPQPSSDEMSSSATLIDFHQATEKPKSIANTLDSIHLNAVTEFPKTIYPVKTITSLIPVVKIKPSVLLNETIYYAKTDSVIGSFMELTKSAIDDEQIREEAAKERARNCDKQIVISNPDIVPNVLDGILADIICTEIFYLKETK